MVKSLIIWYYFLAPVNSGTYKVKVVHNKREHVATIASISVDHNIIIKALSIWVWI